MLVTLVLGSVHGFSILLVPLQQSLSLPRAQVSLIYSLALVAITLAVWGGHRWYHRGPAWLLVLMTCALAAAGLWLCSSARGFSGILLGYSLVFGLSNGFGYGYCLQLAGQVLARSQGFAMGAVTATYAVGSVLFAFFGGPYIETGSVETLLLALGLSIGFAGLLAAALLAVAGVRFEARAAGSVSGSSAPRWSTVLRYWLAYLCAVFAGLMAIGHAAGIALANGASVDLSNRTAATVGVGSTLGGFVAGWLVDRTGSRQLLVGLPLLSTLALVALALLANPSTTLVLLGLAGFSYGAVIAVYPVAIANDFGPRGPRIYGQVFTAWGLAGLCAPWSAGLLFDLTADYRIALMLAALIALASALLVTLFRLAERREG